MRACHLVAGKERPAKHRSDLQRAVAKVAISLVPAIVAVPALANPILPVNTTYNATGTYNILSYGAVAASGYNSVTQTWANAPDNSVAIQNAISAAGNGGTVIVPSGSTFFSAPLSFSSGSSGVLSHGFDLEIDGTIKSYGQFDTNPNNGNATYWSGQTAFITYSGAYNSRLTGSGTIDGAGSTFWGTGFTPDLIHLSNPNTFLMQGVTLMNSGKEHVTVGGSHSSNLTFNGVTITAPNTSPNTVGIDPNGNAILIENCNISTGDDNVAVNADGSNVANGVNNLTIMNNTFGYGHGVSIGSITTNGVKSVLVTDCTFTNTTNGIRLKSGGSNGGIVQNISYVNLTMNGVANPIYFTSWYSGGKDNANSLANRAANTTYNSASPVWQNITISNLTATNASNAGIIYGRPESPIQGVTITDCNISASSPFKINFAGDYVNSPGTFNTGSNAIFTSPVIASAPNIYFDSTDVINGVDLNAQSLTSNSTVFYQRNTGMYDANVVITAVPEPASAGMLIAASALMLRRRRRSSG